jgi:hypothetical protein
LSKISATAVCPLIVAIWVTMAVAASQLVTVNLGRKNPDFGSSAEAAAILHLIRTHPGATRYEATYTTGNGEVLFLCDLGKEMIVRTITRRDGHGTSETWSRHALYRLERASKGGSLNDSPEGKLYGTLRSF